MAISWKFHWVFLVAIKDHQETLPLALLFPPLGELICLCSQIGEQKLTYRKCTSLLTNSLWGNKFQYLSQSLPLSLWSFGVCVGAATRMGWRYKLHRWRIFQEELAVNTTETQPVAASLVNCSSSYLLCIYPAFKYTVCTNHPSAGWLQSSYMLLYITDTVYSLSRQFKTKNILCTNPTHTSMQWKNLCGWHEFRCFRFYMLKCFN